MKLAGIALLAGWMSWGGAAAADELQEPGTAAQLAAPVDAGETMVPAPPSTPIGVGEAVTPPPAPPAPPLVPSAAGSMDFNLLPELISLPTPAMLKLESEVRRRRSMLQWHQALGIATTLLMVGTVITGQLDYTDRYGGGTSTGRYDIWHTSFEAATVVGFTGDALLALFAPVPFPKHSRGLDTVVIHKIAMITAAAGFAAEVPLGIYTVAQEGHINQGTFAAVHLIIGYVTAAAFATGVTALLF